MRLIAVFYISFLGIIDENVSCNLDCGPGSCIKIDGKETCICPVQTHTFINETCIGNFL